MLNPGVHCFFLFLYIACQEPVFAGIDLSMNATVHSGDRKFDHGTKLSYTCQSGYHYVVHVSKIPDLYCQNGVWSGDNKCIGMHI